jgi:hypothetical protein
MKNFTLTHETPSHFVMHNGKSHFHIAKNGLDVPTTDKIRALAKGGKVTQQTPEEAGIEAQAQREADLKQQSPQEKQIENQAKQPTDNVQYNNPEKFAKGGEADEKPDAELGSAVEKLVEKHFKANAKDEKEEGHHLVYKATQGGKIPHYDEGTDNVHIPTPEEEDVADAKASNPNYDAQQQVSQGYKDATKPYAGGGAVASNAVQNISHETQSQAIGRYAAGNPANLAKGGSTHHTQGKYHFHFYDGGAVTHSDKQPDAPPTPLDNYVNLASGGDPGVQLSAQDLDPNSPLNLPNAELPKTPLQQQMDAASQPPSAEESANNLARTMGKEQPFPKYTDTTSSDQAQGPTPVPSSEQISIAKPIAAPAIPDKSDMLGQLNADIKGEQNAILGGKNAEAKGFAAESQAIQANLDQQQKSNAAYQNEVDQITKQNTDLFNNVRTDKINPNQFWDNKSTGGKIVAGIALLLGGASSGLTGKSNPALDIIQKSIQNDIEAQKSNQAQGVNLYKLGLEKYRDTQAAHQYATLQANAILQGQLSKIAAQTGSQTAQFQAQQAIHQLGLQNAELRSNLGLRQAAIQSMNEQPTAKGGVNLDKSRLLTMAGVIPKEEQTNVDKESDDYQKLSQTLDHTDQVFKQAADTSNYTQRISNALPLGSHIPTVRDSTKQYQAITDAWLGNITKDTEGRVTPTDVDLMRKSLPIAGDPPSLVQTKLNNIKDMIRQKYSFNTLKKYKLIPNSDQVSTSSATRQKRFTEGPAK